MMDCFWYNTFISGLFIERRPKMKKVILLIGFGAVLMFVISPVWADTEWDSGHHDIWDGDIYGEIWLTNYATADMWGGDVYELGTLDSSRFSMYEGTMDYILIRDNSIVNIYGGTLGSMGIYDEENGMVNLYAKDVIYHFSPGVPGWLEGNYITGSEQHFNFYVNQSGSSHINIIPEPSTITLLGLGILLFRKTR
jgi:hypothetical protein